MRIEDGPYYSTPGELKELQMTPEEAAGDAVEPLGEPETIPLVPPQSEPGADGLPQSEQ